RRHDRAVHGRASTQIPRRPISAPIARADLYAAMTTLSCLRHTTRGALPLREYADFCGLEPVRPEPRERQSARRRAAARTFPGQWNDVRKTPKSWAAVLADSRSPFGRGIPQSGDVFAAVSERRNRDADHGQSVKKNAPKLIFLRRL